ncbi:MAG: hypothetical protein M3301_09860 [Chloroflexota bacterium]|nr:hypothetical protein [Chloroflexota bacterium]
MGKFVVSLVAAAALTLGLVGSAMAEDICSSGSSYAQNHIVEMLQGGGVNNPDAHKPGSHSGFAGLCLGLGR